MQCTYGEMSLTGVPWQEGCGKIDLDGAQLVQADPLVRSQSVYLKGRGNRVLTISFPVWLEIGDELDAAAYCHNLLWKLPSDGPLEFVETRGGRTLRIRYTLAAFQKVVPERESQSVGVRYTFAVSAAPEITRHFNLAAESGADFITEDGKNLITESNE